MRNSEMIQSRTNEAGDVSLLLDGPIGASFFDEGITAASVAKVLAKYPGAKNITVRINSPGGSIDDGIAIYNTLKTNGAAIRVEIVGAAYSAASFIAMAGDEIVMHENAMMMIHDPSTVMYGDAASLRKEADVLDKFKVNLVSTYSARTGKSEDEISQAMKDETWYTAAEALEAGLITSIAANKAAPVAQNRVDISRFNYRNAPKNILERETVSEPTNTVTTPAPAAIDPRAEAKRFVDSFGAPGGQWYAEGLTFEAATAKHNAAIKADAEAVSAKNTALSAQVADLQKRLDAASAEPGPVSGGEGKPKAVNKRGEAPAPEGLAGSILKAMNARTPSQ